MNKRAFDSAYTPAIPPTPSRAYLHTVQAGAWLPFLQATITALVLGIAAASLAFVLNARHPLTWAFIAGGPAWAATWLFLQRHWLRLTAMERWTGIDLNRDGVIGEPAPAPEVHVRLSQIKENGHYQESRFSLPARYDQLRALARGVLRENRPFTHRAWSGPGAPFSDGEFRALRAEMLKRGLIAPASGRDARQGFVLTAVGRRVLERFLESPSPTLEDEPCECA